MVESLENKIIEKLEKSYSTELNPNNYVIDKEITVEITLKEYRQLIEIKAKASNEIKNLESKLNKRYLENRDLQKENEKLQDRLDFILGRGPKGPE